MTESHKSTFITLGYYAFFVILIYVFDFLEPGNRFSPGFGIFAIWGWCLYTFLMTIKNAVMVVVDKMLARKISLLIHLFSAVFLILVSYYFGGLIVFLDKIT